MGDRKTNLEDCISELKKLFGESAFLAVSSLYKSPPLALDNAPESYKKLEFYNACLAFDLDLPPLEILQKIKAIEKKLGRSNFEKWSPRQLDIDILIYDGQNCNYPTLQIPHSQIPNRDFVLIPLIELLKMIGRDYSYFEKSLRNLRVIKCQVVKF